MSFGNLGPAVFSRGELVAPVEASLLAYLWIDDYEGFPVTHLLLSGADYIVPLPVGIRKACSIQSKYTAFEIDPN